MNGQWYQARSWTSLFFLKEINLNLRSLFPGIVNSQQSIIHLAMLFINSVLLSLSDFTENSFEMKMGI